jgi:hypothetical protein
MDQLSRGQPGSALSNGDTLTLADLFTIKRGLATGANDFFIRPREEVESWRIPADFVKPILPSPRHLSVEIIEADPDGFPRLPKVLCLIDCDRPEHELRKRYPLFWNYLQTGKEHGIHEATTRSRSRRLLFCSVVSIIITTDGGRDRAVRNVTSCKVHDRMPLCFPQVPSPAAVP